MGHYYWRYTSRLYVGFLTATLPALYAEDHWWRLQAIGHFNMIGYALSGLLGGIFKKHADETTENIKFLSGFLSLRTF